MKRFNTGLVVGKFCPLHLGHEAVIARAFDLCERVIVISYTRPEFPGYGPEKRERWLRIRFPDATVLVATDERVRRWFAARSEPEEVPENDASAQVHRRFVGHLCAEVLGCTVDAVFTSEDYGDGFAVDLGNFFAERGLGLARVAHVCVDHARAHIPISGTQLRNDVHAGRRFLAPDVYASFVRRVAVLGGESTGKSTLASELARHHGTQHVTEYGRELWEAKKGRLVFDDLLAVAIEQCAREDAALRNCSRFLFCDTTPLTTLFYSLHLFGKADPSLLKWADRHYDSTLLCAADFPFVQDGTRDHTLRERQQKWYETELARRGVRPWVVGGPLESRVQQCDGILSALAK